MTDFRALCAELTEELVNEYGYCTEWEKGLPLCESNVSELLTRARTALAQPEPQGPTDEELWDLYQNLGSYFSPTEFARTVLARWGRSAIEPVPGVEGEQ
jgi:hypothetical protein